MLQVAFLKRLFTRYDKIKLALADSKNLPPLAKNQFLFVMSVVDPETVTTFWLDHIFLGWLD